MKLKLLPLLPALLFAFHAQCRAQDDDGSSPVSVKITRYKDHSGYSAMKTDPDAHSAENSEYTDDGTLIQTTVFALDENGRAIGGFVYKPKGTDPKGILQYKTRYQYDAANRVSEVDYFTPSDQLQSKMVYHYDAAGKVLKVETFDPAGRLVSTSASSDGAGVPDRKPNR